MGDGTAILDIIENGIFIIDKDLNIRFWNNWLTVHTGISKETAQSSRLFDLYPERSFKLLKRKVKISLKLRSSTFTNSTIEKYVIPIRLKKITTSLFRYMRQDAVLTPLNENEVSVIIYDASPLLEAKAVIDEQLLLVQKQATTDTLTGCYNRKMFNDLLATEVKRVDRHGGVFSLIILDIDDFKTVNDTFGHLVGDEVLIEMANLCRGNIRESDIFARWGGEEFTILLPETDLMGAVGVAEKIRLILGGYDFGKPGKKTCSFGVAEYSKGEDTNTLISKADRALYFSKENGKNQVSASDQGEVRSVEK